MTTETPTDEEFDATDDSSVIKQLRRQIKALETETKSLKDAAEENTGLKQKLALSEAGLNGLSDKQRKALGAAHDGEWTADALKATASELGFSGTPAPAPTTDGEQSTPRVDHEALWSDMASVNEAVAGDVPPPETLASQIGSADSPEAVLALLAQDRRIVVT